MDTAKYEIYISVDVETDGPIPGPYSMVSLGASVAGYRTTDGQIIKLDVDDPANQFYVELAPISDTWQPDALKVSGLDRETLMREGIVPPVAMGEFASWVRERVVTLGAINAVFAAFPLGFDWLFTYWYLINFTEGGSPFSHGRHIDIKTLYATTAAALISYSGKASMPRSLMSTRKHTHNALDDAIEQGELLINLLKWGGKR